MVIFIWILKVTEEDSPQGKDDRPKSDAQEQEVENGISPKPIPSLYNPSQNVGVSQQVKEEIIISDKEIHKDEKVLSCVENASLSDLNTSFQNIPQYSEIITSFLVLSKSAKYGQYCVAGIDIEKRRLIRLVSTKDGKEIHRNTFRYRGKEVEVLDVIDVIIESAPLSIQKENMLLKRIVGNRGQKNIRELIELLKKIDNGALLTDNYRYTIAEKKNIFKGSLMVIGVKNVHIHEDETLEGKLKTRIDFSYNNKKYYGFSVTDPVYFGQTVKFDSAILLLSVSENPYQEKYYKFVAKILPVPDGIEIFEPNTECPKKIIPTDTNLYDPKSFNELLGILKQVRLKIAKSKNLPAFCIFYDKTLVEMVNKRPKTKEEMLKIYGIKETKFNQYGQVFLDTIIDFDNKK